MDRNFIIIFPDPIVCMDIEGMLIAQFPECHVSVGSSLMDIGAAINNCGSGTTLFVKGPLVSESNDLRRVVQTAASRGSQIVIIGSCMNLDVPARFVDMPFTTDMIIAAISSAKCHEKIERFA